MALLTLMAAWLLTAAIGAVCLFVLLRSRPTNRLLHIAVVTLFLACLLLVTVGLPVFALRGMN